MNFKFLKLLIVCTFNDFICIKTLQISNLLSNNIKYSLHKLSSTKNQLYIIFNNLSILSFNWSTYGIGLNFSYIKYIYDSIRTPLPSLHIQNQRKNNLNNIIYLINQITYLELKLKLINEFIQNYNDELKVLKKISLFDSSILFYINDVEMQKNNYVIQQHEINSNIHEIKSKLKLIYKINDNMMDKNTFLIPFLGINENKIFKYLNMSYNFNYKKNQLYENLFTHNNLIFFIQYNFQKLLNKSKQSVSNVNLKLDYTSYINNYQKDMVYIRLLQELLKNYFIIKNIYYENQQMKKYQLHLEEYNKFLTKNIKIIDHNKNMDLIFEIYKKKKKIIDNKVIMLDLFHKRIENLWKIMFIFMPIELLNKCYEINYEK